MDHEVQEQTSRSTFAALLKRKRQIKTARLLATKYLFCFLSNVFFSSIQITKNNQLSRVYLPYFHQWVRETLFARYNKLDAINHLCVLC